jgi:hypothetical protein
LDWDPRCRGGRPGGRAGTDPEEAGPIGHVPAGFAGDGQRRTVNGRRSRADCPTVALKMTPPVGTVGTELASGEVSSS